MVPPTLLEVLIPYHCVVHVSGKLPAEGTLVWHSGGSLDGWRQRAAAAVPPANLGWGRLEPESRADDGSCNPELSSSGKMAARRCRTATRAVSSVRNIFPCNGPKHDPSHSLSPMETIVYFRCLSVPSRPAGHEPSFDGAPNPTLQCCPGTRSTAPLDPPCPSGKAPDRGVDHMAQRYACCLDILALWRLPRRADPTALSGDRSRPGVEWQRGWRGEREWVSRMRHRAPAKLAMSQSPAKPSTTGGRDPRVSRVPQANRPDARLSAVDPKGPVVEPARPTRSSNSSAAGENMPWTGPSNVR